VLSQFDAKREADAILRAAGFDDIELPNCELRAEQPGGRMLTTDLPLAIDRPRALLAVELEHLKAALWRYPFAEVKHRKIIETLAAGGSMRDAERYAHVSATTAVKVRRAVMSWRDPEDAEDRVRFPPWGSPAKKRARARRDARIRQALADGLSCRKVARQVGCSLRTVLEVKKSTNR
jgi:hypothetical protein